MGDGMKVVAVDFETSGLDTYSDTFRIFSCAFSWYEGDAIRSLFIQDEYDIGIYLERLFSGNCVILCHNIQYEMACVKCRYPRLYDKLIQCQVYDTLRLCQVFDNGGKVYYDEPLVLTIEQMLDAELDIEKPKQPKTGLSLTACVERLLPVEFHGHKAEAHDWLRAHGVKKGKEGGHLLELPLDILERYNVGDTENTLRLYTFCTEKFATEGYEGWKMDHMLYMSSVRLTVDGFIRGVRVLRENLLENRTLILIELQEIEDRFFTKFADLIKEVQDERITAYIAGYSSPKGKLAAEARAAEDCRFNIGSPKQLATLFVDKLGMTFKFTTEKGSPSFKSAFLSQWGEGGQILLKRRKRMLVLQQTEAAIALSEEDGRWHPHVRVAGTKTGRGSAGHAG